MKTNENFIDSNLIKELVENSKGRIMTIKALKKDGSLREFNFKVCSENAPSFENHKNLVSIRETNKQFRSFDINRVKYVAANKQILKVVD